MEFLEFFETGMVFHTLLIDAAGNKRLSQYHRGIQYNLLRYHVFQGSENLEAQTEVDHSDLVEKLAEGQYAKAKKYLLDHIRGHAGIIKRNLEQIEK